ncbi:hypothetical protein I4U23_005493 [Adineta vaga]|nr:hypothetical protein I4U23_005493 [Adineta vaga]
MPRHRGLKYMIRYSIRVLCLTTTKIIKNKTYDDLSELKNYVFAQFPDYEINEDIAIITYKSKSDEEEKLLDNINLLPKNGTVLDLNVRRVWSHCAICLAAFGITHNQLPVECSNENCRYQYCQECVDVIQKPLENSTLLRPFLCMFCKEETNPKRNYLLEEHILWRDFKRKYDMDNVILLNSINFFSYNLIFNDVQCRQAHLQSLIDTAVKTRMINPYVDIAKVFVQKLLHIQDEIQRYCDVLIEQNEYPDELLNDYRKLLSPEDCHLFINIYEGLKQSCIDLYIIDQFVSEYKIERFQSLKEPNNATCTFDMLIDLNYRRTLLLQLTQQLHEKIPLNHPYKAIYLHKIHEANCLIEDLNKFEQRIKIVGDLYDQIASCLFQYDRLLTVGVEDKQCSPTYYCNYVHICELLQCFIEKEERNYYFPKLTKQIKEWNESIKCDDEFQPKFVPLFQTIHDDLDNLHMNRSLPYRIGIVGCRSAGKSSLLNRLRKLNNQNDPLFSPVSLFKSTYCFLQYTVNYDNCSITYVDIEGYNEKMYFYEQQIMRANCDAYIIVFDSTFSQVHLAWKTWIESTLIRPCLLVRSKADNLFFECYPEVARNKQTFNRNTANKNDIKRVLQIIRNIAKKTESDDILNKVYLVAPKYPHADERIQGMEFVEFDLMELRDDLLTMAAQSTQYRERFLRMAMNVGTHAINVCFRRGYIVSATTYAAAAGIAAAVPFLEKAADYFAREKIRQVLGVRGDKKKESLENYLLAFALHVPSNLLKSSVFKYLPLLDTETDQNKQIVFSINLLLGQIDASNLMLTSASTPPRTKLAVVGSILVIGARVGAQILQKTLEIVPLAAGVGLIYTAAMCAWAGATEEQRMHYYLNKMCDDIVCVLACFIASQFRICN